MKKKRILVVDDEPSIVRYLKEDLETIGYEVLVAMDGVEALNIFEKELPDLVVLDIKMPRMDGFEVCSKIREWSQTPIIMLTALDAAEDIVKALDLGADDYITKVYSKEELIARVKALLRRTTQWEEGWDTTIHINDLAIDFKNHKVTIGKREANLTATEYRLLSYFVHNAGSVITPNQILKDVWGDVYEEEHHILRVNIGRLRNKLGDDPKKPRFIITRTGIGYMFTKPD